MAKLGRQSLSPSSKTYRDTLRETTAEKVPTVLFCFFSPPCQWPLRLQRDDFALWQGENIIPAISDTWDIPIHFSYVITCSTKTHTTQHNTAFLAPMEDFEPLTHNPFRGDVTVSSSRTVNDDFYRYQSYLSLENYALLTQPRQKHRKVSPGGS